MKIDFIERDDQGGIDWYYRAAELAARHHLMLDFHGATKPTGMDRTWPNVLGYEAVAGMEQSKAGARDNPDHQLTLPFTRMLAGAMDYTPGGFRNVTRDEFEARSNAPVVMGTRAHQLAMYVVYQAPFQMVSDHPGAYRISRRSSSSRQRRLRGTKRARYGGFPGEFVTLARRKGNEWFVGSMTNWNARELDLPLSFLGAGKYRAEIYADAADGNQTHQYFDHQTDGGSIHALEDGVGSGRRLRGETRTGTVKAPGRWRRRFILLPLPGLLRSAATLALRPDGSQVGQRHHR